MNKNLFRANLNVLLGIELLEYEDKNHLSGSNKTRSETKLRLIKDMLNELYEDGELFT